MKEKKLICSLFISSYPIICRKGSLKQNDGRYAQERYLTTTIYYSNIIYSGCSASTDTDSLGNVVDVFNDGDLGVYKHDNDEKGTEQELTENHSSSNKSAGGEKMGETEYWDEFSTEGKINDGTRIYFGTSWGPYIDRTNAEGKICHGSFSG